MYQEEPTSVSELIKHIADKAVAKNDVYEGVVISTSPLKITLVNDAKIILSNVNLVVPEHLRLKQVTVTFTFDGETKSQIITIHEDLKNGDHVYLMAYNNGKKYFVLDRT